MGIVTVAALGLGVQGWFGPGQPDPARVFRPTSSSGPQGKPSCFYTSSWKETTGSTAWLDFINEYPERAGEERRLWKLWPSPEARLCVIASIRDYKELADNYPKRWPGGSSLIYAADWARVPADAVHVTAEAVEALEGRAGNAQPEFYGWNVESTAWFTWRFLRQELPCG